MAEYLSVDKKLENCSKKDRAEVAAKSVCRGFYEHDQRNRQECINAFVKADRVQFSHMNESDILDASEALVDTLWKKDQVEDSCRVKGDIDSEKVAGADWSGVEDSFRRRADIIGADPRYATLSTEGWRQHKAGGDYWTPLMEAQMYEIQAALQDYDYPNKPRSGTSGFGPEPARYVVGVELHDTRRYKEAVELMIPYFRYILSSK